MSVIPDDLKKQLKEKIDSKNQTEPIININEEDFNNEQYLEDLGKYFTTDEQIELAENGIKLTTAKQFKSTFLKSPIWQGRVTKTFKKWLKENYPEDLNLLTSVTSQESNESKETTKKFLTPSDISRKIKENREISDKIDEIFTTDERNELLDSEIQFCDALSYYDETNNKPIINGDVTEEFEKWIKQKEQKTPVAVKNTKLETIKNPVLILEPKTNQSTKPIKLEPVKAETVIDESPIAEKTQLLQKTQKNEIIIEDENEIYPIQATTTTTRYPSEQEIIFLINRHKFVKDNLIDNNDIITIKSKKFVKKSGWRKFINAFGISIELIEQKVYEKFDDKHAEIRVRAIAPNGQSVEGIGVKSWSELYEKTMHNLIATAWTRAVNRAVSDLVGYGEVSAEELEIESKEKEKTHGPVL